LPVVVIEEQFWIYGLVKIFPAEPLGLKEHADDGSR
jgi:hypothetical protein